MKNIVSVKAAKLSYLIMSCLLSLFGCLMIFRKDMEGEFVTNAVGIILICFGGINIWGFFAKDLYRLAFRSGMAIGILSGAVGMYLLIRDALSIDSLCIIVGITVLVDAVTKIEMSIDARAFGLSSWKFTLILGILSGTVGFLLIPHPWENENVTWLGIALVCQGALNILTDLTTIQINTVSHPEGAILAEDSPWGI